MENSDYSKSFMDNVREETKRQQEADRMAAEKKVKRRRAIGTVIVSLIIVAMSITVVILLINRNRPQDEGPLVIGDEPADEGSAYEYDEESGTESYRMACKDGNIRYDFYKNNVYEIEDTDAGKELETGTYDIVEGVFKMKPEKGKERKALYESEKLIDNEKSFDCEEYDDA